MRTTSVLVVDDSVVAPRSVSEARGSDRPGGHSGLAQARDDAWPKSETSFFRDLHPFDTLRKALLPEILARRAAEKRLRIWCGACSTGQEPYSLAMLLRDAFPQLSLWRVQLLATDVSREALARAREGVFGQFELSGGLPARFLVKYFIKTGPAVWRLREEIRDRVEFQELNLTQPFPMTLRYDFVWLRNVITGFDWATRRSILARVRRVLAPDGYLFLGCDESLAEAECGFTPVTHGRTVCYQPAEGG